MATVGNGATQAALDLRATAVTMAARGRTNKAIGEALGVNVATVSQWRQEPAFREAMEAELDRIRASLDAAMQPLVGKALGRYELALDSGDDAHALTVAKDVLDRQYGRAIQREIRQSRSDIHVTFEYVGSTPAPALPISQVEDIALSSRPGEPAAGDRLANPEPATLRVVEGTREDGEHVGIVLCDSDGTTCSTTRWIELDNE